MNDSPFIFDDLTEKPCGPDIFQGLYRGRNQGPPITDGRNCCK